MSSDPLRIAVLGYGLAGSTFHAPVISSVPGLRVTAVVTRDAERAARAEASLPGVRVLGSADDVLADAASYDGVVVASPNRSHSELATRSLEAGLPVVVDKPLAVTSEEGQRLVDLAEERGVALTVYQNRRWDSDFRTLQALVAEGRLGRVHRYESRFERWRPVPKPGWRESGDPADAGGLLNDLCSHLVDQAVQLLGPVASVYAEVHVRRDSVAVDDDVFVALTHVGGERSHLWAGALTAQLGPRLRVLGSAGAYVVHGLDPQEAALREGGTPADPGWGEEPEERWGLLGSDEDAAPVRTLPGAWQEFYAGWRDALLGRGPVPVDPRDAVATLRVLEAARTSSQEGRTVRL
ncbi:putative dehydrogenase [Motilibacter rhizosphaerae]|uniref:Putative dehydrogenase n=1 Tax=Motilibacter rhizosphaerae TaxID=598652 RepID=A0A4Q7NW06_9ACTN|nr:Gfo/Idh/MocA family oxidoreductase [Motilibacter rhizosphaerae]RZS91451.1 putative dehydrogenase [Motilibacter rhizosphaerae]